MSLTIEPNEQEDTEFFTAMHPLDGAPEQKIETAHLGPMEMTRTVRTRP
jgi:hypothetical protein